MNQLNMISNFSGGAAVRSFFAPYFCPNCNAEHPQLLGIEGDVSARLQQGVPCPTCATEMEFDDLPETYISFLG